MRFFWGHKARFNSRHLDLKRIWGHKTRFDPRHLFLNFEAIRQGSALALFFDDNFRRLKQVQLSASVLGGFEAINNVHLSPVFFWRSFEAIKQGSTLAFFFDDNFRRLKQVQLSAFVLGGFEAVKQCASLASVFLKKFWGHKTRFNTRPSFRW